MKRAIILLICAICATSCWNVSTYTQPNRTRVTNLLYQDVATAISDNIEAMDMVLRLDQWCKASSDKEKMDMEDFYFGNYKLRQNGNTISLALMIQYSDADYDIEIDTHGEDILSLGSVWEIRVNSFTMKVECIADDKWLMTTDAMLSNYGPTEFTFTMEQSGIDYIRYTIEGHGLALTKSSYDCVDYKIEKPLSVSTCVMDIIMGYASSIWCSSGEVCLAPQSLDEAEYDARVKIKDHYNTYTIYYRGYSEDYINGYYIYQQWE